MSGKRAARGAAQRGASGAGRLVRAWRMLPHERRLAAYAATGLFLALFLPWYQETVIASGKTTHLQSLTASITGWGAFSFVEAAVLLVAAGVLTLLFQRAEGRAFHLPGGDGWVITAAGLWTCVLIIWRIFDKQGTSVHGPGATSSGVEWGIFVALAIAAFLTYAGSRIRAAHQPEPPLPGETAGPLVPAPATDRRAAGTAPAPAADPQAAGTAPAPAADPQAAAQEDRATQEDRRPQEDRAARDEPPTWEDRPGRAEQPVRKEPLAWDELPTWEDRPGWGRSPDWMDRPGSEEQPTPSVAAEQPASRPVDRNDAPTEPVAAADAATVRMPSPSTRAARVRSEDKHDDPRSEPDEQSIEPDEQRTIPLEPEGRRTIPLEPDGQRTIPFDPDRGKS